MICLSYAERVLKRNLHRSSGFHYTGTAAVRSHHQVVDDMGELARTLNEYEYNSIALHI